MPNLTKLRHRAHIINPAVAITAVALCGRTPPNLWHDYWESKCLKCAR